MLSLNDGWLNRDNKIKGCMKYYYILKVKIYKKIYEKLNIVIYFNIRNRVNYYI